MHVRQQIVDLLLGKYLAIGRHFAATVLDDFADPIIISGKSTNFQIWSPENTFQRWPLFVSRGIGFVASGTIIVVHFSTRRLLWGESEFGIAPAALDVTRAARQHDQQACAETKS